MYHPDAYDPSRPVRSYWADSAGVPPADDGPLAGDVSADVAIVGAGYTGLWAARRLAAVHGRSVRVFDAGGAGWGASGRNGGFACLGGTGLDHQTTIARFGRTEAERLFDMQTESIARVRKLLAPDAAAAGIHGDGEMALAHRPGALRALEAECRALVDHCRLPARMVDQNELRAMGLYGPRFHGGLHVPVGFGLHPLKLAYTLSIAARGAGAQVHGGTPVTGIARDGDAHVLATPGGTCRARQVIVATNGYGNDGPTPAMAGRMIPVFSSILVTRPLTGEERARQGWTGAMPAYDSRHLLHYFRLLPDGRFLFGGRGGRDGSAAGEAGVRDWLTRSFRRLFPAWHAVEITHFWRGLACLAADFCLHVGALDAERTLWFGGGYHGNGVAMSAMVGPLLADLAAGKADPERDVPAPMRGAPPVFRLPGGRRRWLGAAYLWYRLRDALP
ncbi:MAG: FAD-dependent oxidoreductase [Alphaproteobacteria bacterium]